MLNDCDGKIGITERARLRFPQVDESCRAYREACMTTLRDFYTVVDTPRRARPSITGASDHQVAFFRKLVDIDLKGRHRCAALRSFDDLGHAVAGDQQLGEIVHK